MTLSTSSSWILLAVLWCFINGNTSVEVTLLTTQGVTTDMGWNVYNRNVMKGFRGWEEQSIPTNGKTVRGYLVCPLDYNPNVKDKPQSWLLLPVIDVNGASRIFIEMNFTMRECGDIEKTCRETFSVYYRRTDEKKVENPVSENLDPMDYTKIDTVAAEVRFLKDEPPADSLVNHETVSISLDKPTPQTAVHIAIVDVGACMALMQVRVYHKVCPQVVTGLAVFNETMTGASDTALVPVSGFCVSNAAFPEPSSASPDSVPSSATFEPGMADTIGPLYHCTSSGEWQVQTGECQCLPGYQPSQSGDKCEPCGHGMYKSTMGNHKCLMCPLHSGTETVGADTCQCDHGYYTTTAEDVEQPAADVLELFGSVETRNDCVLCSKPPSPPILKIEEEKDPGSVKLVWTQPSDNGGCKVIKYCLLCEITRRQEDDTTSVDLRGAAHCRHITFSPAICGLRTVEASVTGLRGHTMHKFTVVAYNTVTKQRFASALTSILQNAGESSQNSTLLHEKPTENSEDLRILLDMSASTLYHQTNDTLPSSVQDVVVKSGNQTTIAIQWTAPQQPNGNILYYEVRWNTVYGAGSDSATGSPARRISSVAHWRSTSTNGTSILLTQLRPGTTYEVAIFAYNSAGSSNGSALLSAATSPHEEATQGLPLGPRNQSYVIATVAIAVLVIIIICIIITLQWKCRLFRAKKHKQTNGNTTNHAEFRPYDSQHASQDQRTYVDPFSLTAAPHHRFLCETSPESITCENVIGCGEFGEVYEGTLATIDLKTGQETTIQVAVKQLRDQCEPQEQVNFLREAMFLEKFSHPNIVHLEAVVTLSRPFFIVNELMDHGSLLGYLTKLRERGETEGCGWTPPLPPVAIANMLRGVARGMEYLSNRGYVHRDLAARNVLINSDHVCKVADFGLTREVESDDSRDGSDGSGTYTTRGGKIAIRWTAPEAMAFRTYTQYSDVWSFGILMWEATSFGEKPYWDLTNHEVLKAVNDGFRLPAPDKCPSVFHQMMLDCWHQDRHSRPSFAELITGFDRLMADTKVLEIPASPASSGVDTFFQESGKAEFPAQASSHVSDKEVSEPLLTTVMVDRHNFNLRSSRRGYEMANDVEDGSSEVGSEVSSCTSTICASEVTVCAANGPVIYVPLCRSDSEESSNMRASPVF